MPDTTESDVGRIRSVAQLFRYVRPALLFVWVCAGPQGIGWVWGLDLALNLAWVGWGVALARRLDKHGAAAVNAARNYCWFLLGWAGLEWYGFSYSTALATAGSSQLIIFTGQALVNALVALVALGYLSRVDTPDQPEAGNLW